MDEDKLREEYLGKRLKLSLQWDANFISEMVDYHIAVVKREVKKTLEEIMKHSITIEGVRFLADQEINNIAVAE